jgi:hypothetical protein
MSDERNAPPLDKDAVREWSEGWRRLAVVVAEERRAAPLSLRFRQLIALHGLATELRLPVDRNDATINQVRQRWVQLKSTYP